jgi:two-component system phosphate regulon sensor histidine kinase PhoR
MNSPKLQLVLACVALAASLALAADRIVGPSIHLGSALVCWGLLAIGAGLPVALMGWLVRQGQAAQDAAVRGLDLLERGDIRKLDDRGYDATFASPPMDPRLATALSRVRERLAAVGQRLQELEQQRAAVESRARRYEAQMRRMQSVLTGLAEPVIAIDRYDDLILTNPSADELFGIDSTRSEDRALARLVHCEKLVELLTDTRKRKAPSQRYCEIALDDPSGSTHWYRVTARSIAAPADAAEAEAGAQGVVAVLHDISAQKALQKRNAEFVSAVSHEMKTPLAGIKAYVELLVDGDAEDEATQEQFYEIINAQADRLQRLVDNMLNLARIEAGVVSVNKQSRSLNELLEEALKVIHPAAEAKGITLASDLSPLYLGVFVDHDMALQAAINLLSNAVKYTPRGGHVTLRSRLIDHEARFDVEDTGVGLSSEDCVKVFEKFYRVQKDKEMASGTGLGLPLVKHIVEDVHGGRITVQSTPGHGSLFSVFLPSAATLNQTVASSAVCKRPEKE